MAAALCGGGAVLATGTLSAASAIGEGVAPVVLERRGGVVLDVAHHGHLRQGVLVGDVAEALRPSILVVLEAADDVVGVAGRGSLDARVRLLKAGGLQGRDGGVKAGARGAEVRLGAEVVLRRVARLRDDNILAVGVAEAALDDRGAALQEGVDAVFHPVGDPVGAGAHLDQEREGGGVSALQDGLLGAAGASLVVSEGHALDAADEVRERRVLDEVLEELPVRRADEHHAALSDGAASEGLSFGADLVDDDDLGHVVLDGLDHDAVLLAGVRDLHAARRADRRVRDVPIASDLVRGVDDDDPLLQVVAQDARHLADDGGLADAGAPEEQDALVGLEDVADHIDVARDGTSDSAREADDLALAAPHRADAVQGSLDSSAVVAAELPEGLLGCVQVLPGDLLLAEHLGAEVPEEACLGAAPDVEDDLKEHGAVGVVDNAVADPGRQHLPEERGTGRVS